MIILTNDKSLNIKNILNIYRSKDVVEKGFQRFKSSLDFRRIRVHDSFRLNNKEFFCFLAQILLSAIDNGMSNNHLYNNLSIHKLLLKFKSCRLQIINNTRILYPLTKFQKEILTKFHINFPNATYMLLE
jgi:transposase